MIVPMLPTLQSVSQPHMLQMFSVRSKSPPPQTSDSTITAALGMMWQVPG